MAIDADALPGAEVVARLRERVQRIAAVTQAFPIAERPTLACIEWTEPLMAAGNWVPQLVELAGGRCAFGTVGEHSPWLQWDDLLAADPDAIAVMPCGYDLERTQQDLQQLAEHPRWNQLQAVQHGKVYVTDGNAYFNRPGPRLVESLEILAEILHPEQFDFGHRGQGWRQWRLDDPVATSSRQLQMAGQDLVRVERFL
jgi:iron complex transport system substrate-binding protein